MNETLSPDVQAALSELRDIRLPDPISWWPLAPGWWGLLALVLLIACGFVAWRLLRKRTRRFVALRELDYLRLAYKTKAADEATTLGDLAALIRRVALSVHGKDLASQSGESWREWLVKSGLPEDGAQELASAPYRKPDTLTKDALNALFGSAENWIRRTA